jgi:hypothetical protein
MSRQIDAGPGPEAAGRRDFLRLAAATGGAVIAVGGITGTALAVEEEPEARPSPPEQQGYRLSEHVKTYYEKARS